MKNILIILGAIIIGGVIYIGYMLANPVSPKDGVVFKSDNAKLEVIYSRPYKKGRLIFGEEKDGALVPYGKYWRTGANAASTFETSSKIVFGNTKLKAGKYRLYTVPSKSSWKVVLNSDSDKFFAISEPDYSKDVLEVKITPELSEKEVEQFTVDFYKGENGIFMRLLWDKTIVAIPIKTMD